MPKNIIFELPDTFKINIFKRSGGNGYTVIKNSIDFVLRPSYDLGYLFGTFLGDGHALCIKSKTNIGAVHWYFGKNEIIIAEKLQKAYKKITKRDLVLKHKKNIIQCTAYNKPLADYLYSFGKKTNKHLPENLLVNNKKYLQGLLDGLIDSDGCISDRVYFTNTSKKLIELFNVLNYLISGVFPNNLKCKTSIGNLKKTNIENFNQAYASRINKTGKKRLSKNFQISKFLKKEKTDFVIPVYDLTVDCNTHSFIANNAIVHNSICSTRIETGNGVPQMTVLDEVKSLNIPDMKIISDGGMKTAGDVVKSLCFADAVMLGNMLAGTDETPGDLITLNGQKYKEYAGSSTHKSRHIEGVVGLVPAKGPVEKVITTILEGVRSGMSYQGVSNLYDLKKNPIFVEVSNSGLIESRPHDILLK